MEEKTVQKPGEKILIWFLLFFSIFILVQAIMIPGLEEPLLVRCIPHIHFLNHDHDNAPPLVEKSCAILHP